MGMKDCVQGDAKQKSENFLPLFFLKEPARCNCIIIQSIAFNVGYCKLRSLHIKMLEGRWKDSKLRQNVKMRRYIEE
jgi:hypothetical protein